MLAAVDALLNDVLIALKGSNETAVFPADSPLLSRAHAFDIEVPAPATLKDVLQAVKTKRIKALAAWADAVRGPQIRARRSLK